MAFLPIDKQTMSERGWNELDFLFITGDAYIDHPSFGAAILTRLLEQRGFRVGVVSRPDIQDPQSIQVMGRPRYGVLVSSGVVDSMVNNYTAAKRPRRDDRYKAEKDTGVRPDRAVIAYCNLVRKVFHDIPLIIGGVEASLRRFAHYDYWDNKVRRSILQDSQADILSYGMGERNIPLICNFLARGIPVRNLTTIAGTCVLTKPDAMSGAQRNFLDEYKDWTFDSETAIQKTKNTAIYHLPSDGKHMLLPSFAEVRDDKYAYCAAFASQYREQDPAEGCVLFQSHGNRWLIQNPPDAPFSEKEMDAVYALPYERRPHFKYDKMGRLPAIEEVRFSVTAHRGCYGGCNFCAITMHQGRIIQARSDQSVLQEAKLITEMPDFKGYIHDVGGPTANFHRPACSRQESGSVCKQRQCLSPSPCKNLNNDASSYFTLLKKVRELPKVKKVFVRSGIRFDALMADSHDYLAELCDYHISGQLKVAPEHISEAVLLHMGKPTADVYEKFRRRYAAYNEKIGKKQYLVPYLMSGHPGCTMEDAVKLAIHIKENRVMPEQVQDFYPTPGTVSTTMYYTGMNPLTLEEVYVPKGEEKSLQRALLQFGKPANRQKAAKALRLAGRTDLIGHAPECLFSLPQSRSGIYNKESTLSNKFKAPRKQSGLRRQGGKRKNKNTGRNGR